MIMMSMLMINMIDDCVDGVDGDLVDDYVDAD